MVYLVHTDGSSDRGTAKAGWGYSIMTKNHFISYSYGGIPTPYTLEAEVAGATSAFDDLISQNRLCSGDTVILHTDSLLMLSFIDKYVCNKECDIEAKNKTTLTKAIDTLRDMDVFVVVKKVKGHKGVVSPNTFADQLARYGRACITRW